MISEDQSHGVVAVCQWIKSGCQWIKDRAEEDVMLVKTHAIKIVIMHIVKGIIHAVVKSSS